VLTPRTPAFSPARRGSRLAQPKGGHEVDHALAQLKKLGYTKGS